ncbi:hypothetical protein LCGC14_0420170 [marine sediment metagenome]|uniref:RNA polymerase sigma-70 region 4 domain-containing protein n=1 Tax=marine sediment metagenome TaxID=412755 RepID=A0A0F9W064_9ZZZZ
MLTKERILQLRANNPCMFLREIGDRVGVTRERVRQVLKKERLPTRALWGLDRICPNCRKEFHATSQRIIFCSRECSSEYTWIPLICDMCGRLFHRRKSVVMANILNPKRGAGKGYTGDHYFCSRRCFGKRIGVNHGFAKHPENIARGAFARRKWDYNKVKDLRDAGLSHSGIAFVLGMPIITVSSILHKLGYRGRVDAN